MYRPLLPLALHTFGDSSDSDILREVARLLCLCVPLLKELGGLSHVAPILSPKILFVLASSTQLPLIVQVRKSTAEGPEASSCGYAPLGPKECDMLLCFSAPMPVRQLYVGVALRVRIVTLLSASPLHALRAHRLPSLSCAWWTSEPQCLCLSFQTAKLAWLLGYNDASTLRHLSPPPKPVPPPHGRTGPHQSSPPSNPAAEGGTESEGVNDVEGGLESLIMAVVNERGEELWHGASGGLDLDTLLRCLEVSLIKKRSSASAEWREYRDI